MKTIEDRLFKIFRDVWGQIPTRGITSDEEIDSLHSALWTALFKAYRKGYDDCKKKLKTK